MSRHPAIDAYLAAVQARSPGLPTEALAFLADHVSVSTLSRRTNYIEAGKLQRHIGFVYSGLLRAYHVTPKGEEMTVRFVVEADYATHYAAFIAQRPSQYFYRCLEASVLVNLSYDAMQRGYAEWPALERYGRLVAEAVLQEQQQRIEQLLFLTAEERYRHFVAHYPDLFGRVSLSHLCSYLGVERQTLSRIRKQLADR